ncbi:hypothetical protein HY837_04260 [archaeon]|nr:hypothetical protein [archaeon]
MQELIFKKKVSKGTKFNQVYIPKELEESIQPGDLVEVKLLKKNVEVFCHNVILTDFKNDLIKQIFSFLQKFGVSQIFVVGSFLTKKIDYNDIDVVVITEFLEEKFDEEIYEKLIDKFNLKFHVLSIKKENFENLLKICPLTKSMFDKFVSNKKIIISQEKIINEQHIQILLMMPEDLLEIDLNSRAFYDSIRRLLTIERFLDNKLLDNRLIDDESKKVLGVLYQSIKNNESINKENILFLRKIIKQKLAKIKSKIDG